MSASHHQLGFSWFHSFRETFKTAAYIGVNVVYCPSITVLNWRTDATNYITSIVKSEQKLHLL